MDNQTIINLVEKLGWANLPVKDQEYLIERTGGVIFQKIMMRFTENLIEPELDEFEKLLSEDPVDNEKLLAFIQEKIPNSDEIIQKEVADFLKDADDIMSQI